MRTDVSFHSHGTRIAAYLFLPEAAGGAAGRVPCVVMAHGFTATRDQRLPAYAERFCAAGLAVLLFDYRHFGASDGMPRQLLDVAKQHQDFTRAIAFARALPEVDPDRIVLWGSSFSGGHVVSVAARDKAVAAVIAQVPFADGFATLRTLKPVIVARLTVDALIDQALALLGRSPRLVTCAGEPGSYAVLTAPEALPGFLSIDPENSLWRNVLCARLMLTIARYRPVTVVDQVQAPLLISLAEQDATVPVGPARRMAELAPRGEVVSYPIGHFEIYTGEPFERAITDQLAFLSRHGLAAQRASASH